MKLNLCECGVYALRICHGVVCQGFDCERRVEADNDREAEMMWNLSNPKKPKHKPTKGKKR